MNIGGLRDKGMMQALLKADLKTDTLVPTRDGGVAVVSKEAAKLAKEQGLDISWKKGSNAKAEVFRTVLAQIAKGGDTRVTAYNMGEEMKLLQKKPLNLKTLKEYAIKLSPDQDQPSALKKLANGAKKVLGSVLKTVISAKMTLEEKIGKLTGAHERVAKELREGEGGDYAVMKRDFERQQIREKTEEAWKLKQQQELSNTPETVETPKEEVVQQRESHSEETQHTDLPPDSPLFKHLQKWRNHLDVKYTGSNVDQAVKQPDNPVRRDFQDQTPGVDQSATEGVSQTNSQQSSSSSITDNDLKMLFKALSEAGLEKDTEGVEGETEGLQTQPQHSDVSNSSSDGITDKKIDDLIQTLKTHFADFDVETVEGEQETGNTQSTGLHSQQTSIDENPGQDQIQTPGESKPQRTGPTREEVNQLVDKLLGHEGLDYVNFPKGEGQSSGVSPSKNQIDQLAEILLRSLNKNN